MLRREGLDVTHHIARIEVSDGSFKGKSRTVINIASKKCYGEGRRNVFDMT